MGDQQQVSFVRGLEMKCSDNECMQTVCQLNDIIEDFFEGIGRRVGKYAEFVLPIVLLVLIGLSFGMLNFSVETDIYNLWTPTNSPTFKERDFIADYWGEKQFGSMLIAATDKDDINKDILHHAYFKEWHAFLMHLYKHTPTKIYNYTWTSVDGQSTEERSAKWTFYGSDWKDIEMLDSIAYRAEADDINLRQQNGHAMETVPFCRPFANSPLEAQFQLPCYTLSILDCFTEGGYILPYEEYLAKSFLSQLVTDNPYKYLPSFSGMSPVELGYVVADSCNAWVGALIPPNFIFGGISRVDVDDEELQDTAQITGLKGFQNIVFWDSDSGIYRKRSMLQGKCNVTELYSIDCPTATDHDLEAAHKFMYNYMADYIDWMLDTIDDWTADDDHHLQVVFFTPRSGSDLLRDASSADFLLLAVAYIAMIIFAGVSFLRPKNLFLSRSEASSCGVLIVLMSVVATFGVASLVIKFSPNVIQVLPFIALGFGVDDMFVILSSFYFDPKIPVEEMTADALKVSGSSVALTSLANFFAFMVASFMPLPDVARFANVGMIVVALNWFSVVFGFTAVVALSARRMKNGYNDWAWCSCFADCMKADEIVEEQPPHETDSMFDPLFDWLTQDSVRICMILAFLILVAIGGYGGSLAKVGLPLADIVPADSYSRAYLTVKEKYFYGIINTWYSDGKLDKQKRINWPEKFGLWVNETERITTDINTKYVVNNPSIHSMWAWDMRDYFVEKHAEYFGDYGYTPQTYVPAPASVDVGRSSDCIADADMFCPSLYQNYTYSSDLDTCLRYNYALLSSQECQKYLSDIAPTAAMGSIANQVQIVNAEDPSTDGIYLLPSSDKSYVFFRDDGAVLFRREDYTWVLTDNEVRPLFISESTDTAGTEPPQQQWFDYHTKKPVAMTAVVFDFIIYALQIPRSDDFLVGDLAPRTEFVVTSMFVAGDEENEQACLSTEVMRKMLIAQTAYTSVYAESTTGDSISCDAVLEASDICYGVATGDAHGQLECGSVETGTLSTQWYQGACAGVPVVAAHATVPVNESTACACTPDANNGTVVSIPDGTHILSPCDGPDFGGFGLNSAADCSATSQEVTITCNALTDCTSLSACFEFAQDSSDAYCTDTAIERYTSQGSTSRLGRCLLPNYAELTTCCQSAVNAEIIAVRACSTLQSWTDSGSTSDVCDNTDHCDSSCVDICKDDFEYDCREDIVSANCDDEYDAGDQTGFETCMDSATLSTCCASSYAAEAADYSGCLIPLATYWNYTDSEYDYESWCSAGEIASVSCTNADYQTELDCLLAANTSSLSGCCIRALDSIQNSFVYTAECEGDVAQLCGAGEYASDVSASCASTLIQERNLNATATDLSSNCYETLHQCNSDGTWPDTAAGDAVTMRCANGYVGDRTRSCVFVDGEAQAMWGAADESQCVLGVCPSDTTYGSNDALTWAATPVFNVRSYIGDDTEDDEYTGTKCSGINIPGRWRRCGYNETDGSALWEDPTEFCRLLPSLSRTVAQGTILNDTACTPSSSLIFAIFYSDYPNAAVTEGTCESICDNVFLHCNSMVIQSVYGQKYACLGYDYCEQMPTPNTNETVSTYTWLSATPAPEEFIAVRCSGVSPHEAQTPQGIPHPNCFNMSLWQWMVDPSGGVLSRDSLLVNNVRYLYSLSLESFTSIQLVSSSSSIILENVKDDQDAVKYIIDVRKFINNNFVDQKLYVIPSGLVISLYSQYVGVSHYMVVNLGYVSIAIVVTGIIFLLHPVAVLLVCLCDFAMLLEIYGFSDWVGLRINGVLALNIVIAVGVSMEFTAHMARAYMLAMALPGEKIGLPGATEAQIRLKKTYREMFTPVSLGAITTILGVAPISAATFPYFRQYYFVLYVFIVMFGWINGVIFLPIMLSLMNPHPWGQDLEKRMSSMRGTMRHTMVDKDSAAGKGGTARDVDIDEAGTGTDDGGEY